jgi:hypothetical protein
MVFRFERALQHPAADNQGETIIRVKRSIGCDLCSLDHLGPAIDHG